MGLPVTSRTFVPNASANGLGPPPMVAAYPATTRLVTAPRRRSEPRSSHHGASRGHTVPFPSRPPIRPDLSRALRTRHWRLAAVEPIPHDRGASLSRGRSSYARVALGTAAPALTGACARRRPSEARRTALAREGSGRVTNVTDPDVTESVTCHGPMEMGRCCRANCVGL